MTVTNLKPLDGVTLLFSVKDEEFLRQVVCSRASSPAWIWQTERLKLLLNIDGLLLASRLASITRFVGAAHTCGLS